MFNFNNSIGVDYGLLDVPETPSISRKQHSMEPWLYFTWIVVFSCMIFVAIGGNLIVMWIVTAHRRMRTVTNYFLVNLAVADLLMSSLNCLFNFIYMLQRNWPFGDFYCIINNFMATVTVSASVFTLTAITCDRYMAIVRPLQPRMSKRSSIVVIVVVWLISAVTGAPCLMYSTTNSFGKPPTFVCILVWPDGPQMTSHMDFVYQVSLMLLNYFLPIVLMTCCYIGMGRVLWGSRSIGELSQRQADSIRSKRKVVKMFIFVMIVFGVCWLPYHSYFVYTHFDRHILSTRYVQHVFLSFYWLAMSNAMVNPLIYYWMNARFRKYFNTVVCGWRRCIFQNRMSADGNETPVFAKRTHSYSRSDDGNGVYKLSRWLSRRSGRRRTTSTVLHDSTRHASPRCCNHKTPRCQMNDVDRAVAYTPDKNGQLQETAHV